MICSASSFYFRLNNLSLSWCSFVDHWCLLQLDGYIARNWPNQKSALGSALDPLADKILISVLYVSLTYAQLIPGEMNRSYKHYISAIIYWPADPDLKGQFTQKWQFATKCSWLFLQSNSKEYFSLKLWSLVNHKMQIRGWESNKAYQAINTHESWRYIEVLWSETISLCKKMNISYNIITCNPEPQANGLEWSLVRDWIILLNQFSSVHQIWLKRLKQFTAWAAQIYKFLNQNSLSDAWKRAKLLVYLILWWMNHSVL